MGIFLSCLFLFFVAACQQNAPFEVMFFSEFLHKMQEILRCCAESFCIFYFSYSFIEKVNVIMFTFSSFFSIFLIPKSILFNVFLSSCNKNQNCQIKRFLLLDINQENSTNLCLFLSLRSAFIITNG